MASDQLDLLTQDWKRLRAQKSRKVGGLEARCLLNLAFVNREHYVRADGRSLIAELRDQNKLYLMFDLIGPRMNKLLGRLSSIAPPFKARPDRRDPKAFAEAEVVDRLMLALDDKLIQPSRTWEHLWWMAVGGTSFEYTPWIPNASVEPMPQFTDAGELIFTNATTGQQVTESQMSLMAAQGMPIEMFDVYEEIETVGDVGSEVLGPLNVFVDQTVRSIADLAPDQRVHIARIRTVGWVEENFGVQVEPDREMSIVSTNFAQTAGSGEVGALSDLIPLIQGSKGDDDPDMVVVVEAYTPASKKNPHGLYECFVPGKQLIHSQENPYEEIPLVDFHWQPVTTNFWTPGYVEALIPPQRFINKRVSQLGEQSNATIYSTLLLGGTIKADDIPADFPGTIPNAIAENGLPLVQRLGPPELPTWFLQSLTEVVKMFNDIAGGSDLFQESKFPGQLRGPMAVPLLQEVLDTEWGPLYRHIGERMARVKQQRLNRVKQFYPPMRTMHYTDRNQKDEVLVFHAEKVLRGGLNFNITLERGELMPEFKALREAKVAERLNGPMAILYMDERTGRLDKSKIAEDLKLGDEGRESRESQYRKLGQEIVSMLWRVEQVPPVLPFYDHAVMMDELEAAMATTEFLKASPPVQQAFAMRWEAHRQYLIQEAEAQQQMMMAQQAHSAIAQATQQAAAMAAAGAVDEARQQSQAQSQQPTGQYVAQAEGQAAAQAPPPRKRTLTVKEEG